MKQLIYKLVYFPPFNFLVRNTIKTLFPFLSKSFKIPPSGILKLDIEGKELKLKTNQTNYLSSCIFWEGYNTFEYTSLFTSLIKKVNCFYDIGANIGYYSLLAARLNPSMKIRSFEPALGPLHYLRENVAINDFKNISVESVAIFDKEGEIEFYEVRSQKYPWLKYNLAGEGNAGSKTNPDMFVKNRVKSVSLDQFNAAHQHEKVDLIKMDTEGTEHILLKHGGKVIETSKPIVICETLFNTIEKELNDIFLSYGYEFYNHTEKGLEKVSTLIRAKDNGVRNCFFVHPEKRNLIEEFIVK